MSKTKTTASNASVKSDFDETLHAQHFMQKSKFHKVPGPGIAKEGPKQTKTPNIYHKPY